MAMAMCWRSRCCVPPVQLLLSRSVMTATKSTSKYLTYHPGASISKFWKSSGKPRVLFWPWFTYTKRTAQKHIDLYTEIGCDVIFMRYNLFVLHMWPKSFRSSTAAVLKVIHEMTEADDLFLVHAVSGGGYAYADMHREMTVNPEYRYLKDRIVGHVFDSLPLTATCSDTLSNVFAAIFTSNPTLQRLYANMMIAFINANKSHTKDFFNENLLGYLFNHLSCMKEAPSLFIYHDNDLMIDVSETRKLIQHWRQDRGMNVIDEHWKESVHATHLKVHHDEYIAIFEQYLDLVKCAVKDIET